MRGTGLKIFLIVVLAILFFLAGCGCPRTIDLPAQWYPLTKIVTDKTAPHRPGFIIVTVYDGHILRTHSDMCEFLRNYPRGSHEFNGLLTHERIHAMRQLATVGGPQVWAENFTLSAEFRWAEESLAWEEQIKYLIQHGKFINQEEIATFLSSDYYRMIGRAEAEQWLKSIVAKYQSVR